MTSPRPNRRYCSDICRQEAFQKRQVVEEIREAEEAGVANVERQLAEGAEQILVEGKLISREAAWAATQGIRKTWEISGARVTGQTVRESGQWWVLVQLPLGQFPG